MDPRSTAKGSSRNRFAQLLLLVVITAAVGQVNAAGQVMPTEIRQALLLGDTATAVAWLEAAVAEGNSNAAYELGKLYHLGKGVPKNRVKALELVELAASADNEAAVELLDQLRATGNDTTSSQAILYGSPTSEATPDWFSWISAEKPPPSFEGAQNYEIQNDVGTPLLVHAVEEEQMAWLAHLLARKVNLRASDARGNGVLHCAVRSKNPSLLKILLAAGAPTNLKNAEGATALHLATALGNRVAVKRLLQAGSGMNEKNNSGWSAVMIAERSGNSELLSLFGRRSVALKGRKAAVTPVSKESLLHLVRQGKLLEVKRLLNAGIHVDSKSQGGDTPLTLAVSGGHQDLILELLAYGADVNLANGRSATPLHLAVQNADEATIRLLLQAQADTELQNAAKDTPLQIAVKRQCGACVKRLIKANANIEAVDKNGMSPLLLAAKAGERSLAEALLIAGANPAAVDNANRTSLWWAVKKRHSEVAFAVLDHSNQGDISTQADLGGVTPLHLAVQGEDLQLVRRLAVSETLDVQTKTGSSALLLAAYAGAESVVKLLLERDAQVDQTNSLGDTALMAAIQQRHLSIAVLLAKAGASLNHHNLGGLSARDMIESIDEPRWSVVMEEQQGVLLSLLKSLSE